MVNETNLSDSQMKAIDLMVEGKLNLKQIAAEVEAGYQTVRKWRTQKDFVAELAQRRREASSEAQAKLQASANHAAERLIAMIDDPDANRINFQAAKAVLEMALQSGFIEFEERLQQLEEALAERQV